MENVAKYINEYKRKKDLASKYLHFDNTLMRKMGRLSMHSVAKKSSRLGAKLYLTLGLTHLPLDEKFNELEREFGALDKCARQLAKDVELCLSIIEHKTICCEVLAEQLHQYYQGVKNDQVLRYRQTRSMVKSKFLSELKQCVETRVNSPLQSLISLLEGPALLITKRYDKILDYDIAISRSEKVRDKGMVS